MNSDADIEFSQFAVILLSTVVAVYIAVSPLRGSRLGTIPNAVTILFLLLLVGSATVHRTYEFSRPALLGIFSLFGLLVVAVLLNPIHERSTWETWYTFYTLGVPLALFATPVLFFRERWQLRFLLNTHFLTMCLVAGLILLVGFGVFLPEYYRPVGTRIGFLEGVFRINTFPLHSTSLYGVYIVPALTLAWARAEEAPTPTRATLFVGISVVFIGVTFLVQSRKVYLAVLLAAVTYGLLHPRLTSMTISTLVVSLPIQLIVLTYLVKSGFAVESLLGRFEQYVVAIPYILANPLGTGSYTFPLFTQFDVQPHNYILAAGTGYGIPALMFVSGATVATVLRLLRTASGGGRPFLRAGAAGTVGMFVVVVFDPNYQWQRLWLLAGIFLAYAEVANK